MKRSVPPIVVFVVAVAAFLPAFNADFVDLDDHALLIANDRWRGLGPRQIEWMFTTTLLGHYQPLTWLSYGLNYVVGGLNPVGYHAVNILLHAVNAVLLYFVAVRLLRAAGARPEAQPLTAVQERLGAGVGAILWAAHPLRVESVAWVTERRDVLSTFFLLLALLAYLRAASLSPTGGPGRRGWGRAYVASILLLALSLLSKAWGMSFFVILLFLDWYPLGRLPRWPREWVRAKHRAVLIEKAPYAALGVAFAVIIGRAFHSEPLAMKSLQEWPLTDRFAQAAYGLVFYVWKSVAPTGLAPRYMLPRPMDPFARQFVVSYAALAAGAIAVLWAGLRRPAILCAVGAYVVLLAPVLGFMQSGDQLVADRYSYVACIGWSLVAGAGVAYGVKWARGSGKFPPAILVGGVAAVLVVMGVATSHQASAWKSPLRLWKHSIEAGLSNAAVHVNYGLNLEKDHRDEEAIEQYRLATRAEPDAGKAWYVLAKALSRLKRFDEADRAYAEAVEYLPLRYIAMVNRGNLLIRDLGRTSEGLALLRDAVADVEHPRPGTDPLRPKSGVPHLSLGAALLATGDREGAIESLRQSLKYADTRDDAVRRLRDLGENP